MNRLFKPLSTVALALALGALAAPTFADQETWPARPIHVIVPGGPLYLAQRLDVVRKREPAIARDRGPSTMWIVRR